MDLTGSVEVWEIPRMKTLKADERQRLRIPEAKPGQVFSYEPSPDGSIKLVPVIPKPGPRRIVARLVRKGDALVAEIPKGYKLAPTAIEDAITEERESRS
jgi:hypothetical protein